MSDHDTYSPSKLNNLALCPGWISNPEPGPAAIRGTAVHGHLAAYVRGETPAYPSDLADVVEVGMDMFDQVKDVHQGYMWQAETPVDTLIPGCSGTADVVGLRDGHAVLIEWKTGRGDRPDSGTNLQAQAYALGVFRKWSHIHSVRVILAELEQGPTSSTYRRDYCPAIDATLRATIARAATAQPGDYRPSVHACQYCGRIGCEKRNEAATGALATITTVADARDLPPDVIGERLRKLRPLLKQAAAYVEALEAAAKQALEDGQEVPGFALRPRNIKRTWGLPQDLLVDTIANWCSAQGISGVEFMEVCTPSEVERRLVERLRAKMAGKRGAGAIVDRFLSGIAASGTALTLVEV